MMRVLIENKSFIDRRMDEIRMGKISNRIRTDVLICYSRPDARWSSYYRNRFRLLNLRNSVFPGWERFGGPIMFLMSTSILLMVINGYQLNCQLAAGIQVDRYLVDILFR